MHKAQSEHMRSSYSHYDKNNSAFGSRPLGSPVKAAKGVKPSSYNKAMAQSAKANNDEEPATVPSTDSFAPPENNGLPNERNLPDHVNNSHIAEFYTLTDEQRNMLMGKDNE